MHTIYSIAGLAAVAALIYGVSDCDWRNVKIPPVLIIIILGLTARYTLASVSPGYENDINCFKSWADRLYANGFSNIYFLWSDVDYPPGYMYVLYVLGALHKTFGLSGPAFGLLVKTPPILCDIITSCIIYRLASKKFNKLPAFFISLAYALNPAIIMDSVIWGQVDSVHTALLFASILALSEKRRLPGYIYMALAVLVKPQSLALAPIFIYDAAVYVLSPRAVSAMKRFGSVCLSICIAGFIMILLALPFARGFDLLPIAERYQKTLLAYPYATVNAYNLYAYFGLNWKPVSAVILPGFPN